MKKWMLASLVTLCSLGAQAALVCQGASEHGSQRTATEVVVDKGAGTVRVRIEKRVVRRSMFTTKTETSSSSMTYKMTGTKKTVAGMDILVKGGTILKIREAGEAIFADKQPHGDVIHRTLHCN